MAGTTHNKRAADAEPRANAAYVSPLKRVRAAVARMQNKRSIERIDELKEFIRNNNMKDSAVMSSVMLRLRVVWTSFDTYKGEPVARIHLTDGCSDDKLEDLHLERLFPHLLTFGIGGFSTTRSHRYSHHKIVLHYLNLSTNRFAEDSLFKLAMFDYISTARVKNGVFLRVGQDPALATTVMRVTPGQLRAAMRNRTEQRKAWKIGHPFTPATESPVATRCLKSITATTSKMWGSNDERESMARKVDAMTIKFGAPSSSGRLHRIQTAP